MIAEWLLKSVKVKRTTIERAIELADKDADGYVSLGEIIEIVRRLR